MLTISPIQFKSYSPNFKGYSADTEVVDGIEKISVRNYTGFMRNYKTLDFTKNYIVENFPNGTHIAEFGCSTGQKTYSLLLLLDEYNKNKKYKITGYDFPEIISKAKMNFYDVEKDSRYEHMLFPDYKNSNMYYYESAETAESAKIRKAFFKYFQEYKTQFSFDKKIKSELNNITQNTQNLQKIEDAQKEFHKYETNYGKTNHCFVSPKEKITKNLIDFIPGNIKNIDKIVEKGKTGVVIFQNALYHMLTNDFDFDISDIPNSKIEDVQVLFRKIHSVLPKNGIFVLGNFPTDHLYNEEKEDETAVKEINGQVMRVYDTSLIHKALKKAGFTPVFYETVKKGIPYCMYKEVNVPSVWKKT